VRRALPIALVLLSAGSWTADASAVSQVAAVAPGILGPEVDGDRVIWGEGEFDGTRFRVLGPDGRVSQAGFVAGGRLSEWSIDADGGELAYRREETFCPTDRCYGNYSLDSAEVAVGPHGGPYGIVDRCPGSEQNPEACEPDYCSTSGFGVDLSDRVLTYGQFCQPFQLVVRDLDTGDIRVHDLSSYSDSYVTGRYLAVRESSYDGPGDIVVSDSLTAEERFRVEESSATFAIAPDGLLVLYDPETGELSWASPQDPSVHHIANVGRGFFLAQVRHGLIAGARRDAIRNYSPGLSELSVYDLAGRQVSEPVTDPVGGWDFDGRRLAWGSAPCEIALVLVWDVRESPPHVWDGDCPVARPVSASRRVHSPQMLRMKLQCPDEPPLGCSGAIRLVARKRTRGRRLLGTANYAVLPGETDTASLQLGRATYEWFRQRGRVKVVARLFAVRRDDQETQARGRFKFFVRAR
jgi:hypothetical protein